MLFVLHMLAWFERAVEFLKVRDLQHQKALSNLIEAFYDTSMVSELCSPFAASEDCTASVALLCFSHTLSNLPSFLPLEHLSDQLARLF